MPVVNSHVINFVLQNIHLVVSFMLEITRVKLSVQQTTPFDIEDSGIILHCTVCLKNIDNRTAKALFNEGSTKIV